MRVCFVRACIMCVCVCVCVCARARAFMRMYGMRVIALKPFGFYMRINYF